MKVVVSLVSLHHRRPTARSMVDARVPTVYPGIRANYTTYTYRMN